MTDARSLILQSASWAMCPKILAEIAGPRACWPAGWGRARLRLSGGALVALAYALARSACLNTAWGTAHAALGEFAAFLGRARPRDLRTPSWTLATAFTSLRPASLVGQPPAGLCRTRRRAPV